MAINLFINWLLDLTLNPRFNQAIKGFTRPLWVGHYGLCFTCHKSNGINGHKGQQQAEQMALLNFNFLAWAYVLKKLAKLRI